jgi:hypothetical protein
MTYLYIGVEEEPDPAQAAAIDITSQYSKKNDTTDEDKYDVYRQVCISLSSILSLYICMLR